MRTVLLGLAIAGVVSGGAAACSGHVASGAADSGPGDGSPPFETGSFSEGGGPVHDGGAHEGGVVPAGSDSCNAPGVECVVPPRRPDGGQPTGTAHQYAIRKLYLGDTDRVGVPNAGAWKAYGYDLDGLVTTKVSTDVCRLVPGASKVTQVDGNGGIDNSFGENILPILVTTGGSDFGARVDQSLEAGLSTNLLYVTGFDDAAGNTTSAKGLTGAVLGASSYPLAHDGGAPAWDTSTHWPIDPATVSCFGGACTAATDPVASAIETLPAAYQAGGTFVSGPVGGGAGRVVVLLGVGSSTLPLTIAYPVITFAPKAPGSVSSGTIAGVLDPGELDQALQIIAGNVSTSLCSGSAFQSIAQQIRQASDIVVGSAGVANGPGVACNAISIGLGFEATEIALPTGADIGPPVPPPANPCRDP